MLHEKQRLVKSLNEPHYSKVATQVLPRLFKSLLVRNLIGQTRNLASHAVSNFHLIHSTRDVVAERHVFLLNHIMVTMTLCPAGIVVERNDATHRIPEKGDIFRGAY
jgi:hypothetical protein